MDHHIGCAPILAIRRNLVPLFGRGIYRGHQANNLLLHLEPGFRASDYNIVRPPKMNDGGVNSFTNAGRPSLIYDPGEEQMLPNEAQEKKTIYQCDKIGHFYRVLRWKFDRT